MSLLDNELAEDWYQLFTPLNEYQEEADIYHHIFQDKQKSAPS